MMRFYVKHEKLIFKFLKTEEKSKVLSRDKTGNKKLHVVNVMMNDTTRIGREEDAAG